MLINENKRKTNTQRFDFRGSNDVKEVFFAFCYGKNLQLFQNRSILRAIIDELTV